MTRASKPARFVLGILVFAIVGPPVGGMVAWLGMGAAALRAPVPFIAGSWGEGGALALATGVATAIGAWRGVTTWIVPVAAAAITALFIAATAGGDRAAMLRVAPVLLPPAMVAALACWLPARRLFRR